MTRITNGIVAILTEADLNCAFEWTYSSEQNAESIFEAFENETYPARKERCKTVWLIRRQDAEACKDILGCLGLMDDYRDWKSRKENA